MRSRKLLATLSLYVLAFYVIYLPPLPFLGKSLNSYIMMYALAVAISVSYLFTYRKRISDIIGKKNVIIFIFCILISSLYYILVRQAHGFSIDSLSTIRIVQNCVIIALLVVFAGIIDGFRRLGYDRMRIIEVLFILGAIQGAFCVLSLFIPALKEVSNHLYSLSGGSNPFVISKRVYGISGDFTFGTQIYHGLLAGIAIYFAIKESTSKYYRYVPFILLASMLNGRTGVLIFILSSLTFITFIFLLRGHAIKAFKIIASISLTIAVVAFIIGSLSPATQKFIMSFVDETHSLFSEGQTSGNYATLQDTARVPTGIYFIFGEGYRVYEKSSDNISGFRSDVGYTNDLYMGGLVFCALIYLGFAFFLLYAPGNDKLLFVVLLVSTMIVNYKGEIFRSITFMSLPIFMKLTYQLRRGV